MSLPLPLTLLESVTNRVIRLDQHSLKALADLDGRVIAIHSGQPRFDFFIQPQADGIRFLDGTGIDTDVSLRGDMSGFIKLLTNKSGAGFSDAGVRIEGDIETAQKLKAILEHLDPDWEEELSRYIGDIAAHQVGRAANGFSQWLKSTHQSLEQNSAEYFREEARILAKKHQVEKLMSGVDTLREDVDRLTARIEQLKSRS